MGWLVVVAHRTAVRLRRARQRRHSVESRSPSKATRSPDVSWQEAVTILHDELDRLPARHRQVLLLCYLEGKSRDEAASELGWTNQAVKGALERGRDRLRGRLQKRGIALSAGLLTTLTESGAAVCPATLVARTVQQATGAARWPSASATIAAVAATKSKFAVGLAVAAGLLVGVLQLAPPREAAAEPPAIKAKPLDLKPKNLPPATVGEVAVWGRVVGPDGKPVAGANLFVRDGERPKPIPQGATKADGSFAFTVPAQAGFHYRYVIAMAPALGCDWAKIPAFGSGKEVVLKLPEDVPIAGRLVDLEGKPVAGAAIRLESIDASASDNLDEFLKAFANRSGHEASVYLLDKRLLEGDPLAALFHATSDVDGRFTIRGIGRDRVPGFIIVSKAHAQSAFRVVTRPGYKDRSGQPKHRFSVVGPDFTLILAPGKEVTGIVRNAETKMPLGGVRVAVRFVAEAEFLRRWHHVETTTDLAGRYSLRGLEAGKSSVVLFDAEPGRGYLHAYSEAPKPNDFGPSSLDMSLRRGVVVEGRVTDKETGKPIRANLWYRPLETNDFLAKTPGYEWLPFGAEAHDDTTQTDADGRYKLSVLPGPGLLHFQTHDLNPTVYPTTRLDPKDGDRGVYGPVLPTMLNIIVFKTVGRGGHYGPESLNAYRVIDPRPGVTSIRADVALWAGHTRKLKILDPGQTVGRFGCHGPVADGRLYSGRDGHHRTGARSRNAAHSHGPTRRAQALRSGDHERFRLGSQRSAITADRDRDRAIRGSGRETARRTVHHRAELPGPPERHALEFGANVSQSSARHRD